MTPRQVALVQDSWNRITPIREMTALLFYARLFELDPSVRPHFSSPLEKQGRRLMSLVGTAVACLGRFHELAPGMQDFGGRYATYPLSDSHDDVVGEAFLWSLELALDTDFTPEVKHAWSTAYPMLSNVMKDAANDPAFTQAVA